MEYQTILTSYEDILNSLGLPTNEDQCWDLKDPGFSVNINMSNIILSRKTKILAQLMYNINYGIIKGIDQNNIKIFTEVVRY